MGLEDFKERFHASGLRSENIPQVGPKFVPVVLGQVKFALTLVWFKAMNSNGLYPKGQLCRNQCLEEVGQYPPE